MSSDFRVFHALRKGASPMEAQTLRAEIKDALRRIVPDLNVVVTSAEEDFNENMARLGGWDAWEHDVATGIRYDDRQPRFHAIIITDSEFGKATSSIVRQALTASKLVLFYDSNSTDLNRVEKVITLDEHNWKTGWCAHLL
jgi:hypothetical protein